MQRTYLALATVAATAATAATMTELASAPRWASAAPSRAPLAQQQQRNWVQPSSDSAAEPRLDSQTAVPPGAPPPPPEAPRIVALQVIPFSP